MQTILQLSIADHNKVAFLSTLAQTFLGSDEGTKNFDKVMEQCGYYDNGTKQVTRASLGFRNNDVQLIVDFTFKNDELGDLDNGTFYIEVVDGKNIKGDF